jgi:hypothetical protein
LNLDPRKAMYTITSSIVNVSLGTLLMEQQHTMLYLL